MATTPEFLGPDNQYRTHLILTTDRSSRFLTGRLPADTADVQVSIREAGFTSDPETVIFSGTEFTIPNPSSHPEGLQLYPGDNSVRIRAVLTNGAVTDIATADIHLALDRDVRADVLPPGGITFERFDDYVTISIDGLDDPNVVGYNFYAATSPGGGTSGYTQINPKQIVSGATVERLTPIGELTADAMVVTQGDGSPIADPLYLRVTGAQRDRLGTQYQTDFDQMMEIPDTFLHYKTTVQVQGVDLIQRYSFVHDRKATLSSTVNPAIPNAAFNTILDTDPLYYVVTAIYWIDGAEYESAFSPEVLGSPLQVTTAVTTLPTVTRQQILRDTVLSIYRSQPDLDVKPGSVLRDTFIDPFTTEAERIRFIIGFLQAAQSFATLLAIDDPSHSGTSVAVSQSPYKVALRQAFFLRSDSDVQTMIDNAFDHLASRRGVTRNPGTRARGEATFYVTIRPTALLPIVVGQGISGGSSTFRATSSGQISPDGIGTTYSPSTGRYSVRVFIQADSIGKAGNLAVGQIQTVISGPSGVRVTNEGATFGGADSESNLDLAVRADGVLSSVDSGTYRGYVQKGIAVPGIIQATVVDASHPLMMRDWDAALGRHTGGKVDIWVRGESLATVTDDFAFTFEIVKDGQFAPVGDVSNLKFRAINAALSDSNPIIEILDRPDWGFEFKDLQTGHVFDLTDVLIIPPDGLQLSLDHNDPADVHVADGFVGSYRYRTSDKYVFRRQPVRSITSFTGDPTRSGTVSTTLYMLFAGDDPLNMGKSSEAGDYIQVVQPTSTTPQTSIPSGEPIVVTGESHVILGGVEYLGYLGANPLTVQVWNVTRTVEYKGPYDPSGQPDFTFVPEDGENPLGLRLTTGTTLVEGESVLIDYQHDENFTVEYTTNSLVAVAQQEFDQTRHITADVLAKESVGVPVDIEATLVLKPNYSSATVDGSARTALARFFGGLVQGQPVRQADMIGVLDGVEGVSYVVVPLIKLAKGDGAMVVRESVASSQASDFQEIPAWATDLTKVFVLRNALTSQTLDGGGEINEFRGVFLNNTPMTLFDDPPNINGFPIKLQTNSAFIIGSTGMVIPDYSDDATLQVQYPFATAAELAAKRIAITSSRVLVVLSTGTTPATGTYHVTYTVYGDTGARNIEPGPTEFLELGNLEFTFDVDTGSLAIT